jgi:hypothetical protein
MRPLISKAMIEQATFSKMDKPVQLYLMWALGLLVFYLVSPVISYLIFWGVLPRFKITLVSGMLLATTLGFRLLLLVTGQLPFRSRQLALAYLLLLWISILQYIWFPTISAQIGLEAFLATIAFTFVGAWVMFLGGEALAYLAATQLSGLAWTGLIVTYLSLAFTILNGVARGFRLYGMLLFAFRAPMSQELYNYLALADSLAITGLLLLGKPSGRVPYKSFIFIITLFLLLFAYSRASLFFFVFTGFILLALKFWSRRKQQLLLALSCAGIAALTAFIVQPSLARIEGSLVERSHLVLERISAPFTGSDPSLQARWELFWQGLRSLEQHWLLGYFMNEAVEAQRGVYMHNWLSFWLAYGIGPFLLSIWLMLSLIARSWHQRRKNHLALLAFCLLTFTLLAIVFARSYIWPYFWLGVGFAATVLPSAREKERLRL